MYAGVFRVNATFGVILSVNFTLDLEFEDLVKKVGGFGVFVIVGRFGVFVVRAGAGVFVVRAGVGVFVVRVGIVVLVFSSFSKSSFCLTNCVMTYFLHLSCLYLMLFYLLT
jgi:hypothetical protein